MNKVVLMGRLTRDPELRYTNNEDFLVVRFTLAVNRRYAAQGRERQTDFFTIVAWNKLGEFCNKYFKKGQQVAITGRLQNRTWQDDQGKNHTITEVIAEEADFAEGKRDTGNSSNFEDTFGTSMTDMEEISEDVVEDVKPTKRTKKSSNVSSEDDDDAEFKMDPTDDDLPF